MRSYRQMTWQRHHVTELARLGLGLLATLSIACGSSSNGDSPARGGTSSASGGADGSGGDNLGGKSGKGGASDGGASDGGAPAGGEGNEAGTPGSTTFPRRRIAAGGRHWCVVTSERGVECFGAVDLDSLPAVAGIDGIATAESEDLCAVTQGGDLQCWGDEIGAAPAGSFAGITLGEVAFGCAVSSADHTLECWDTTDGTRTPADVPSTLPVADLGASSGDLCVLSEEGGEISCYSTSATETILTDIPAEPHVEISSGPRHVCARDAQNQVHCWGGTDQLANIAPLGEYLHVATGDRSACAITLDRAITCWGTGALVTMTPPQGEFLELALSRDYLFSFACGIRMDGTVACWGDLDADRTPPDDLQALVE
jgi:hypothetical protein